MNAFTKNLDELLYLSTQKFNITRYLKKNYRENIHYIIEKNNETQIGRGGHNKQLYMLTEQAFELLKNSFNLRNTYIVDVSDKIKCLNIGMCIENQTIGFITNAYSNILNVKRQYTMGKYRVDLYFIDYNLVIECDENGHIDRDSTDERNREEFIISLGNKIIRYNPNTNSFDLSNVLREINAILFSAK